MTSSDIPGKLRFRAGSVLLSKDVVSNASTPAESYSPTFLRLALGFVYFHFGVLKFYPDLSPAELIATQTVMSASFHFFDASSAQFSMAIMETVIGLGLILNVFPRITFFLFFLHMTGTFLPLVLLPEFTFKVAPLAPTIEGQYIFKNIVFVAVGWTVLLPQVLPRRQHVNAG